MNKFSKRLDPSAAILAPPISSAHTELSHCAFADERLDKHYLSNDTNTTRINAHVPIALLRQLDQ